MQVEVGQDLHADAIVAAVGGEAERLVRFDGVEPLLLLQLVGADLVAEADAAALLAHVDEDPAPFGGDLLERQVHLFAAVAAHRVEDVAGNALRVHADEDGLGRRDVAADEGGVLVGIDRRAVSVKSEVAPLRRQDGGGDALDEPLALSTITDEFCDADDLQVVTGGKALELRQAHHRAVRVHQLADGGDGLQPGEAREINGRLCLAGAHEDAAFAGAQGIDVTGHHEVVGLGVGAGEHLDGACAVGRRDAGGHALAGIDGDGERGAEGRLVVLHHHRDVQRIEAGAGHRHTDHAARVAEHESHVLGGGEFAGETEVALVLAAFVVDDYHEASAPVLLDRILDAVERAIGGRPALEVLLDRLDLRASGLGLRHGSASFCVPSRYLSTG